MRIMIIEKKRDMRYFLKKTLEERHHAFKVSLGGNLVINGSDEINIFLAYHNGIWYGGKGDIRALARRAFQNVGEKVYVFPDDGRSLFVISEKRFWMKREDGYAEYSSTTRDLSKDAVAFMMAVDGHNVCMYVIDGSKNPKPMMIKTPVSMQSVQLAAVMLIALVRQYDSRSADQMEHFWFSKETVEEIHQKRVDHLMMSLDEDDDELLENKGEINVEFSPSCMSEEMVIYIIGEDGHYIFF